jgi:hypothetical protein
MPFEIMLQREQIADISVEHRAVSDWSYILCERPKIRGIEFWEAWV